MHALSPIRPLPSLLRVLYSPFMNCTGWTCMRYGERLDVGSWEMRDTLSRNNANLGIERLPGYVREIGLDGDVFDACLSGDRHQAQITQDSQEANRIRVTGTPSFVIGKTAGDTVSGQLIIGAQAPAVFTAAIQRVLDQTAADRNPPAKKPDAG